MGEGVRAAFGLAGGLALFLFGMESMSRALQQAAGERMRGFLRRITRTPLTGALAGLLVTAVLQSSSATTVMVIGFVSAGLMELPQAVAVVFGANVGTTMTAQLVAFRLADWVFPILFAGVLVWLLARRERMRQLGLAVFSFGLLFDGIEVLSGAMAPLAEHPVFLRWMTQVRHTPLLGLLLGTGMTLVVQSSSATIAVLQRAAQQAGPDGIHSVLGLAGALPILLGDNIGTTITAVLAAVGQPTDARRTAAAHCCFNLSGSVVCLLALPWMTRLVEAVSPISLQYAVLALLAAMYGPVAGGLIGFIGHTLIDLSWGGSPWWSWVIASAFVGVVVGLFAKKLDLQEGEFGKKKMATFTVANIAAHLLAWVVVAPVLDILIYAEPVKKVFAQGAFAAVSNIITAVVVGGLLVLAYTRTIAKKGSLDQE